MNRQNFLIAPSGDLGDIVCHTTVFRAIREKYPNAKISAFGSRLDKEILDNAGLFDQFIIRRSFFIDLLKIKKAKIDFACITDANFKGLALLCLARIPLISAPVFNDKTNIHESRFYKILVKCAIQKKFVSGKYLPLQRLFLLEPAGIYFGDTGKHLGFTENAREKASKFYKDNRIDTNKDFVVGITPTTKNKVKLWEAKKFAKVADYLFNKYGAKIVIFGGKDKEGRSEEMIRHISRETFFANSTGVFNIDELKAAISTLDLFIGVDTGPIYIAEAFGVATVDIVGAVDENEQPPMGEFHKIVKLETRKRPALNYLTSKNRDYDQNEAERQINDVSVEMVTEKIDELIPLLKNKFYEQKN